ncbi:U4/U6 small nuclear ribonucleoprotein Prp3 [Micromonas pusilla CCMP1545]|uniref:U4/U6 small nuclear ribonucleoprotein Prp3 n=1 Tax=Micromonas pusilla (strain CCMP1545) TaxID=564608 RepID=C1N1Y8_MICPC|nr:U4/U6 small nuclear ribonucleoprotein Prp3 [Micromonas pusilla CCMP1545]EEH53912.1 U4/U6 small nuclear ribonucleoprotein Prp3 [Micromonas pusilla CCMP1545]|eukprot:XP_003062200.1 U4/U6 small nuclear ribonucleoprotein Prp3 [Micromonas pusilla CCMP1545]
MAPPKRKAEDDPPPAPSPSRRSKRTKNAEDPPPSSSKDDDDVAAPAPPPADAPAPAKAKLPALDALAKAKAVLQKQKELAEKLKKVPKLTPAAPAPAIVAMEGAAGRTIPPPPPPPPPSSSSVVAPAKFTGPGALRLNEKGEEVDEHGRVIVKNIVEVSTFKVNAKRTKLEEFAASEKETEAEAAGGGDDDWMDPRMGKAGKQRGRRGGFQFVKEGRFQAQADMMRLQAKFGETEARKIAAREARERRAAAELEKLEKDADPNLIPLGARAGIKGGRAGESAARAAAEAALALDAIPDVEWWDAAILATGSYDDVAGGKWNVKPEKISLYVEHPVPMQPPTEAPPPPPQPLKLTKREQKKLRTQRRMAREQEKQEMIKQGLLEPPKPKVKISNLMRVLTDEATADPTAVEREVREQMAERQSAHDDRNEARKLTPAERREKKMRKLFDDPGSSAETQVHVYRVESMANPKNKFRVDINAQENKLTGVCLITDSFSIVIVEGGLKSVRRYEKLMMRRIDWNVKLDSADAAASEDEDEDEDAQQRNKCTCVWKGTSPRPNFTRFKFETLRTEAAARKYLADINLAHHFDAAAACVAVNDDGIDSD